MGKSYFFFFFVTEVKNQGISRGRTVSRQQCQGGNSVIQVPSINFFDLVLLEIMGIQVSALPFLAT